MNETCITRIEHDSHIGVYTSERKFINKLRKLQQEYPDKVKITHENPDGSLCADLPYDWMPFPKPPTKRNYTPEQKEAMKERMKKARETRNKN